MTTSSTYKRMLKKRQQEDRNKITEDYKQDMEFAEDKGRSTDYLRNQAMNTLADKAMEQLLEEEEDEQLLEDYGRDAPKARRFMTKRADGGTATMPEDLGYMVGGAMKEKKRGPIKYAAGGAVKGKKFSGIF
tara:strand:- start:1359 stop:1754 length:396 start_codon:yes stop_codon:yes gene_type:complete